MRRLTMTKRRMCIGAFTLVAAPLLLASVASACTQLKNLNANPGSGAAGVEIQVTGTNYVTSANTGPVEIRLDSRTGAPIATLPVASINSSGGTISLAVTIPADAAVGYHTLIATQRSTTTGALLNGFPVRATYRVTPAASPKESTGSATEGVTASAAATETAPSAAPLAGTAAPRQSTTDATPAGAEPATASAVASTGVATGSAGTSAGREAAPTPASPAAAASGASMPAQAAPALETSTPALAASAAADPAFVSAGLVTAVAERSSSALPQVMLALGAAMVLLSLGASLMSGRSVFTHRRPGTLA